MMPGRKFQIRGVVPVIPTPFTREDDVDCDALRRLVDVACAAGACAICLPAYAGEFYKLSEDERRRVVSGGVQFAGGRIRVLAQINYTSVKQAVENACWAQAAGADAISVAVPRQLAVREPDLLRYFDRILSAIQVPLLIQDFNPGGPTISAPFIAALHRMHPHFRWVKLEEPMMTERVLAIRQETGDEVGVLEGWGGMYMLELLPAGICGIIPSLGLADLLVRVYDLATSGDRDAAFGIFAQVLPQIVFSLQQMELYHHAEKRLLQARGILADATVRDLRMELPDHDRDYIDFLNAGILRLLDRVGLPRCPIPKNNSGQAT